MYFTTVTAFHRLRMMGVARHVDLWRRGNAVWVVPRRGVSEAELAERLVPPGTPISDPASTCAEFFIRSFPGSNLHYASSIDEEVHRPPETWGW